MTKRIDITDYGAVSGGEVLCTAAMQRAIDKAAELECEVYIPKGTYLTGALFLKSNMSMHLAKGAVLQGAVAEQADSVEYRGTTDGKADCPIGIINVFRESHVRIYGAGTITGQGDCFGTCNVLVRQCNDVRLEDFACVGFGCESIYINSSTNVSVKDLDISGAVAYGTEGINIDCCTALLIEQCRISCMGNSVCIMTGRETDTLQSDPYCENIMVRGCEIVNGEGITLGNGFSGTMRNISVCDNTFRETCCGFSMITAGKKDSLIEDVEVTNLQMEDVSCCFCLTSSKKAVSEENGLFSARNVRISRVTAVASKGNSKPVKAFFIEGLPEAPFEDFVMEEMQLQVREYGTITNVKNLRFVNVAVDVVE